MEMYVLITEHNPEADHKAILGPEEVPKIIVESEKYRDAESGKSILGRQQERRSEE